MEESLWQKAFIMERERYDGADVAHLLRGLPVAAQGRLFERDIYTEKFISAADAQQVRSPLFKAI